MTTPARAAWFARSGLAAVLSFALSGAAALGSDAAAGSNPCGEQRGACDFGCPLTCGHGACARMLPAVPGEAPEWIAAPIPEGGWVHDELAPPAPPPLDGVFHPPTA